MSTEANLAFSIPPHLQQQPPSQSSQLVVSMPPHLQHHRSNGNSIADLAPMPGMPTNLSLQQPQPLHPVSQQQQQAQAQPLHSVHLSHAQPHSQQPPQQSQQQSQQQQPVSISGAHQTSASQTSAPPTTSTQGTSCSKLYTLHLSNLPQDLSKREATLMFALVIDDIINIEQIGEDVFAYFKTLNTCITTGKLLEGKYLFGNEYLPIRVVEHHHPQSSYNSINQPFNSLRLSNSNISPPHININTNTSDFQKRQSIGNQRSRFLFSDPFSGSTTPTSAAAAATATSASGPQSVTPMGGTVSSTGEQPVLSGNGSRIDLSDITGKSFLLMESQNDAREYEQLMVRDPWKSGPPNSSTPQTPSASNQGPFDWANAAASAPAPPTNTDRRRTSSSFFNVAPLQNLTQPAPPQSQSLQHSPPGSISSQLASQVSHSVPALTQHQGQQTQTQQPQQPQQQSPPLQPQPPSNQASQAQVQHPQQIQGQSQTQNQSLGQVQNDQTQQSVPQESPQSSASRQSKDVPDLSLLARVPPPANPADQNPPCNTLYVGNLPPDATEAELRALFSPQKGFRRLSFRTKTQSQSNPNANSHNHGPMCFVEFEDVAHATRALAELYGRALPRPGGSNGKGGIRLSFSKNPLGVRGPGNPRRTSAGTPLNGSTTNGNGNSTSSQTSQLQPTSNGIGNYGYLSYHKA